MTKKRLITVVLSIALSAFLAFGIIACNRPDNDVGIGIFLNSDDNFRSSVINSMKSSLTNKSEKYRDFNANGSQSTQNESVSDAIINDMKGMLIVLVDPNQTASMFEKASQAQIPIIQFSSEPSELNQLEAYDKGYLVSSVSSEAGLIDAIFLERLLFGISEEGLTIDNITSDWYTQNKDKLVNNVQKYNRSNTLSEEGVPVLSTLLAEGDSDNFGSTDRTRAAMTSVNTFYDALSKVEDELISDGELAEQDRLYPTVALKEIKESEYRDLEFGGNGFVSKFMKQDQNDTSYKNALSGFLQYKKTVAASQQAAGSWSGTDAQQSMGNYLTAGGGVSAIPDIIVGASDEVSNGVVSALNVYGYNVHKDASNYDANKVIPIVSTDGSSYGDSLLEGGQIIGTALQSPDLMAEYAINMLLNLMNGRDVLDGTNYEFDNSIASWSNAENRVVENKIIRVPYTEYKPN